LFVCLLFDQVGFVVLKSNVKVDLKELEKELIAAVRNEVGAVASYKLTFIAARLPKTRSGKLLRNVMRRILDGETDLKVPPTVEDVAVVQEIKALIEKTRKSHQAA